MNHNTYFTSFLPWYSKQCDIDSRTKVGDCVETFLHNSFLVVRDGGLLLRIVEAEIVVLFADKLSDTRLPSALLVPRHAAVFAAAASKSLRLPPQRQHYLLLRDRRQIHQLLLVAIDLKVRQRVLRVCMR